MSLQDKIAIITGGNRGIGRATAVRLAEAGATVIIAARNESANQQVVDYIENVYCKKALAFSVDVTEQKAVEEMVASIKDNFGRIDILVNNAGIYRLSEPVEDIPDAAWDQVLAVNLKGILHCVRPVISLFKQQRSGKIINIASLAGEVGGIATAADYVASKAAVIGLTKSLARSLGPYGINVNAVAPGFIKTDMTVAMQVNLTAIPLGRVGEPEDIADAVFFLASDLSRYITGTTLDVNGGLYMK